MSQCPCGSGAELDQCCGPIIASEAAAPTPEALMRSRFTAFARGDLDHIENTQIKNEDDEFDRAGAEAEAENTEWVRLEILDTAQGGAEDDAGMVEFAAHYKQNGAPGTYRGKSNFRFEDGRWLYIDGEINPKSAPRRVEKIGRNQLCPCGSGKFHFPLIVRKIYRNALHLAAPSNR